MKLIHLYYVTGTVLVLLTFVFSALWGMEFEDVLIFAMAGFLFIILGLIQHIMNLNEKCHQIEMELEAYSFYKAHRMG